MARKVYQYYQPNKMDLKDQYGDCVIRALTKAMDLEWLEVFDQMQPLSRELQVPFNCKPCYEKYITSKSFSYVGVSNKKGSKRPTVKQFANQHREGVYILRVAHHLVTVVDGIYYDTWDSGHKSLYGYWIKEV